jgi:DNA-binding SARP family transcriptional activator
MITFHVLGALQLRGEDGRLLASPLTGSKRLGLLAYLVLAGNRGLVRRDRLLGFFWREVDDQHARNALSNMLHQIRRAVGQGIVVARGNDELGLTDGAVWCDAVAFEEALDEGRAVDALDRYRGDRLEGFFATGASHRVRPVARRRACAPAPPRREGHAGADGDRGGGRESPFLHVGTFTGVLPPRCSS